MEIDVQDFKAYCLERGEDTYVYTKPNSCALAQYLKDRGICDSPSVGSRTWNEEDGHIEYDIPTVIHRAANQGDWVDAPCTFESVARRLEDMGI